MKDYFRIYMQKEGDGNEVKDSIADFGMYVSENPFKPCDSVKEPPKGSGTMSMVMTNISEGWTLYGGIRE